MPSYRRCALLFLKTHPAAQRLVQAKEILAPARSPRRRHSASDRTRGAGRLVRTPERFWRCADAAPPPSAYGWGRGVFLTAHRPQQLARTLMRPRRAGNRRDRSSVQRNQKRLLDVNANPPGRDRVDAQVGWPGRATVTGLLFRAQLRGAARSAGLPDFWIAAQSGHDGSART
jgi:hypothetical protein